jgi:outer membrane lipoprotein-sorting protein
MEASMRLSITHAALFVAALVLAAPPVHAQTVDDIIARNIEAKGGRLLLMQTTSVRTTGKGMMQGAEVLMTSLTKRPSLMRNEMTVAGQKMIQGYDGETVWVAAGGLPAQALPPGPMAETLKQTSQIDSPLLDYKAKGTKIELGKGTTENGRKVHHLIVTPKGAPTMHYYIDAETSLESKLVIDVEDGGKSSKMEMRFSDFQDVDGRKVPMTITQVVDGNQVVQFKYDKIEFNVPLDDSLFKMPK